MNTPPTCQAPPATSPTAKLEPQLWDALSQVIDPEIGLNLVDLGLIYSVTLKDGVATVIMTVTTPGCPMEHSLVFGVETAVLAVPGIRGVHVEVVYDPPWTPSLMTEAARVTAGIR